MLQNCGLIYYQKKIFSLNYFTDVISKNQSTVLAYYFTLKVQWLRFTKIHIIKLILIQVLKHAWK